MHAKGGRRVREQTAKTKKERTNVQHAKRKRVGAGASKHDATKEGVREGTCVGQDQKMSENKQHATHHATDEN